MTVTTDLAGVGAGTVLALVVAPGAGVAVAWDGGARTVATDDPASVVSEMNTIGPRWTWWSARVTAGPLLAAGVSVRACWDVGAVGRLIHGLRRDDPGAAWAAQHDLPEPNEPRATLDLFDLDLHDGGPVGADGQLSPEWVHGRATADLDAAAQWAQLVLDLQRRQHRTLASFPDPRAAPRDPSLALLTAYAESAASVLAVELEQHGLPVDRDTARTLLRQLIGDPPADAAADAQQRQEREAEVRRHIPGTETVDLRSPGQVRAWLAKIGLDVPDTRSWRLEPHAATSPAVAALLGWRKTDRLATTYGWRWLGTNVGSDGRLRGRWASADGGAGRMTAMAGLHNLPSELRPAVRSEPDHLLVRADLGQVEPRVLAAISGDKALLEATHDDDMYAPVAARLRCDRPTAKVALLAAMYGQTSGPAGDTMRMMDRAYPQAVAFLRTAEAAGRSHTDMRTYGGRLIRLSSAASDTAGEPTTADVAAGHGRFARNAAVQGPAAELFKAWAATVRDALIEFDGRIVLCLHDELLVQTPSSRVAETMSLLHGALASTARWWAAGTPVRFVAEVAAGADWSSAH